jgi:membrane-associated phospholipid phosphatase
MTDHRMRTSWLLRRHEAGVLAAIFLAFTLAWFVFGWLLTRSLAHSWIVRLDRSVANWFVERRTPGLNSLSFVGSMMADTVVKVVVTALVALVMLIRWRRWLEPLMVVVPLVLEATCFITVTTLVDRPRPDVPRLDSSPVGSSFPSGHMAAAVVYSAIVVVIFWHTRNRWIRSTAVAFGVLLPVFVGFSRMYRGMHYLTDVTMGALLGGASVVATALVLRTAARRYEQPAEDVIGHPQPFDEVAPTGMMTP